MESCIFCKIIAGKIPSQKVFEDEFTFAFKDIHPQAETHILVIPKTHVESLAHLKDLTVMEKLFSSVQKITESLGIHKSGYRIVINTGENGGQTVFHLHLHILSSSTISGKFA